MSLRSSVSARSRRVQTRGEAGEAEGGGESRGGSDRRGDGLELRRGFLSPPGPFRYTRFLNFRRLVLCCIKTDRCKSKMKRHLSAFFLLYKSIPVPFWMFNFRNVCICLHKSQLIFVEFYSMKNQMLSDLFGVSQKLMVLKFN